MIVVSDTHTAAPEIEFPCDYPIKVMGVASAAFRREVVAVCERHAPGVGEEQISERESRAGNYVSITVVIEATGQPQLERLFAELKTVDGIRLVL